MTPYQLKNGVWVFPKKWKPKKQFAYAEKKMRHGQLLGDRLALLFKKIGVERAVKRVFGKSCGCAKRQNLLNRLHRKLLSR